MDAGFSLGIKEQASIDDLKKRLLARVQKEEAHFQELLTAFYEKPSLSDQDYLAVCKELIACIDKISSETCEESLFLRNAIKPLHEIRQQAANLLEQCNESSQSIVENIFPATMENENKVLLYISLYQNDGLDIKKWELQLRSIERYLAGRPAYQHEEEVKKAIRLKIAQTSEAYIVVCVKKTAIQNDLLQIPRLDRGGNPLVNLAAGAVTVVDILEFVHQNQRYRFTDGKLLLKKEVTN